MTLEEVKIEHILLVLKTLSGNKTRASKILGCSIRMLRDLVRNNERLAEFRKPNIYHRRGRM
jgi:DNA-binding protein Fis